MVVVIPQFETQMLLREFSGLFAFASQVRAEFFIFVVIFLVMNTDICINIHFSLKEVGGEIESYGIVFGPSLVLVGSGIYKKKPYLVY